MLRAWLERAGVECPSRARLLELLHQARTARSDTRLLVRIGDREVRRYRGLLLLKRANAEAHDVHAFRWQGEEEVSVPGWGGALRFSPVVDEEGFDPEWLRGAPLEVRPRGGGERFKPHPTRPSKTLKRLFQDAGIPEFERGRLPLLWRKGDLIYVAGLGADVRLTDRDGERILIEWQPDAGLIDPRAPWYPGRPVMVTVNDYGLGLFNGDIGICRPDPAAGGALRVFFPAADGGVRAVPPLRLPEHETAYALTVHKSQGSEFDRVLLILPGSDSALLTRELLYTALTRARQAAQVWATDELFVTAVARRIERRSGLCDALWGLDGNRADRSI